VSALHDINSCESSCIIEESVLAPGIKKMPNDLTARLLIPWPTLNNAPGTLIATELKLSQLVDAYETAPRGKTSQNEIAVKSVALFTMHLSTIVHYRAHARL
jgi:hypothetical protein